MILENETFFKVEIPVLQDMVKRPYLTYFRKYGHLFLKQSNIVTV